MTGLSNTQYNVVMVNTYDQYNPRTSIEVTTGDKGFATWLRNFLSEKEESPFILYSVEEVDTFE